MHAATLRATGKGPSKSQALAAGVPCSNPGCKACDKTKHTSDNCYWPGGGKEGQFPPNFSHQRRANHAAAPAPANMTCHFVLAAHSMTVEADMDENGITIDDGETGERIYQWNGTRSFWHWNEPEDSDSESSSGESDCTFDMESVALSAMDYSDTGGDTDYDMLALTNINNEEEEEDDNVMPPLHDIDAKDDKITCDVEPEDLAFVIMTFEGRTPSTTLMFMDSGARDYFFRNREDLTKYTPVAFCTGSSAVEGKGTFDILGKGMVTKTFRLDGRDIKLTFKNALHSPSLAANLISVSSLDKAGLSTVFSNGQAVICDGSGHEGFTGRGSDGMYVLDVVPSPQAMASHSSPVSLADWHRRLAHMNPAKIEEMASKNLVDGLNITSNSLDGHCEDCILARHAHHPFNEPTDPNVEPLKLVAMDLWGPSRTASVSRKTYMMIFVDSGTSFKDGEFLVDKSDETMVAAFDRFREMAETQMGKKVKHVRANRAFAGLKWADYCTENGILLELTASHSSVQNGLAEQAIHMTMEDTRALLSDSGLADCFWAEAASMSIFTCNLVPST